MSCNLNIKYTLRAPAKHGASSIVVKIAYNLLVTWQQCFIAIERGGVEMSVSRLGTDLYSMNCFIDIKYNYKQIKYNLIL